MLSKIAGVIVVALGLAACSTLPSTEPSPISKAFDRVIPVQCEAQRIARLDEMIWWIDDRSHSNGAFILETQTSVDWIVDNYQQNLDQRQMIAAQTILMIQAAPYLVKIFSENNDKIKDMEPLEIVMYAMSNLAQAGLDTAMATAKVSQVPCLEED